MAEATSLARFPVTVFGRACLGIVGEMGRIALFFASAAWRCFLPPWKPSRLLQHTHFIGAKSLFVVSLTALFTGMVLGLQLYYTLVRVGSEAVLGFVVALSLIRELGPVLTALMITGRAGSAMAAEIGSMRISEQIDALDTMNIHPVQFLVSPRLLAAVISFPLLTAIFDVVGILGAYLTGCLLLGVNSGTFFGRMEQGVLMEDINGGFVKSLVFAVIVATICCYQGYTTHRRRQGYGARSVGYSTTNAVVISSVMVLVGDYVLTSFLL